MNMLLSILPTYIINQNIAIGSVKYDATYFCYIKVLIYQYLLVLLHHKYRFI